VTFDDVERQVADGGGGRSGETLVDVDE